MVVELRLGEGGDQITQPRILLGSTNKWGSIKSYGKAGERTRI